MATRGDSRLAQAFEKLFEQQRVAIGEKREWAYAGAALVDLEGFPGIVWARPKGRKKAASG